MTERWERELKKLGDVGPSAELRSRVDEGPHGGDQPPTPGGRQRVVAGVVAFAVFIAAGSLAWNAFRPGGGSPAASGTGAPSGPTVHLDFNTTNGTPDCPGSPEATITYGDQSTKAALTSFTWTCPGSSMNADTVTPSFSDADFVRVPAGAELLVGGDLTAAEGNLQSSPGDYPWTTLHELGDLGGGVSLSFDPGRYVIEVIAHWPNGALHFYFPIELEPDQPVSTTPLPSLIPDVLKVSCDGGAPSTLDPTVAVQVDGLHVRMVGQAPPGEQIALFGPNGDLMQTAQSADASSGQFVEFTSSGGPGTYFVKCYPIGSNVDPATINAAATVTVVDPNGYWVSTELACPRSEQGGTNFSGLQGPTPEEAIHSLLWVLVSDTVEPAGYTQYSGDTTWRVVRDGAVIAWFDVSPSQRGWQSESVQLCQNDLISGA